MNNNFNNPFDETPTFADEWHTSPEEQEYFKQRQAQHEADKETARQAALNVRQNDGWWDEETQRKWDAEEAAFMKQQTARQRNEVGTHNAQRLLEENPALMTTPANAAMMATFMKANNLDETDYSDVQYAYRQLKPKLLHRDLAAEQEALRVAQRDATHVARRVLRQLPEGALDNLSDEDFAKLGAKLGYNTPGEGW